MPNLNQPKSIPHAHRDTCGVLDQKPTDGLSISKRCDEVSLDDILTLEELVARYSEKFTKAQLTWLMRNRHVNGLQQSRAVSLVSKKFYINLPRFAAWLASQNI